MRREPRPAFELAPSRACVLTRLALLLSLLGGPPATGQEATGGAPPERPAPAQEAGPGGAPSERPPEPPPERPPEPSPAKLTPVPDPAFSFMAVRSGVDLTAYDRIAIGRINIHPRPRADPKLNQRDLEKLEAELAKALVTELTRDGRRLLVLDPGPGALYLEATLWDVVFYAPLGFEPIQTQTLVTRIGSMRLEVGIRDAPTGELIVEAEDYWRGRDYIQPRRLQSPFVWGEIRRVFRGWSEGLARALEMLEPAAQDASDP